MKRLTALLLAMLLCLCLPGCRSSESDDAWDEAVGATPQPAKTQAPSEASREEDTSRKLVITTSTLFSTDSIIPLANEFMACRKDVEITFDYEIDGVEYGSITEDDYEQRRQTYLTQLKTKLMTGEAPDIIYETAAFDVYAMTQGGVYRDLSEYWERDIDPENYFMSVVDAMRVDGKLPLVPFHFNADVIYANRHITDALGIDLDGRDSITADEMIDWYDQAREQGIMEQDAPMFFGQEPEYWYDDVYRFQRTAFIDPSQREAHFDDPQAIDFLSKLYSLPTGIDDLAFSDTANVCTPPMTDELLRVRLDGAETEVSNDDCYGCTYNCLDYVQQAKEGLFAHNMLQGLSARDRVYDPYQYMAGPFMVTDSAGRTAISHYADLVVTSSCQDPELAWEFIQYCISERDSMLMNGGTVRYDIGPSFMCINKNNCRLQVEDAKKDWQAMHGYENLPWYWAEDVSPEDCVAAFDNLLGRPLVDYSMYNVPGAHDIIEQLVAQRLIEPAQAAAKLQDQAYIWLNE